MNRSKSVNENGESEKSVDLFCFFFVFHCFPNDKLWRRQCKKAKKQKKTKMWMRNQLEKLILFVSLFGSFGSFKQMNYHDDDGHFVWNNPIDKTFDQDENHLKQAILWLIDLKKFINSVWICLKIPKKKKIQKQNRKT